LREEKNELTRGEWTVDVRIFICGMGRVGQAFANLLVQKGKDLQERYDLSMKVVAAVDIGGAAVSPAGLPLDHPLARVRGTEKAISYLTDTMDRVTVSGGKSNPVGAAAALLKDIIRIYRN
jgi:homoserine dehydrogenase